MGQEKRKGSIGKAKLIAAVIFFLALILAFIFDKKISMFFSAARSPVPDFLMIAVLIASIYVIAILPSILVFMADRKELIKYWFSLALTLSLIILVKMIVHRQRPFQALDLTVPASLINAAYSTWDFSFPSNHAALSAVSLPFLNGKFLTVWIVLAAAIIVARLYFGLHYLSDVLAGIMIGLTVTFLVRRYIK